jgi:hypothetical protein
VIGPWLRPPDPADRPVFGPDGLAPPKRSDFTLTD